MITQNNAGAYHHLIQKRRYIIMLILENIAVECTYICITNTWVGVLRNKEIYRQMDRHLARQKFEIEIRNEEDVK